MLFDNNVRGSSPWLAASITVGLWQNKGQCTKSHRGKTFLSLNVQGAESGSERTKQRDILQKRKGGSTFN